MSFCLGFNIAITISCTSYHKAMVIEVLDTLHVHVSLGHVSRTFLSPQMVTNDHPKSLSFLCAVVGILSL